MNSYDVQKLLEAIAADKSKTGKRARLEQALKDPLFREVVRFAYDPNITFGITPPEVITDATWNVFDIDTRPIWATLHALASRALVGNDARQTVLELLLYLGAESSTLLFNILSKDLRAGFSASTINKIDPELLTTFEVMLAKPFEASKTKIWPVAVEPKFDGVRVICRVDGQAVTFLSRTGHPYPALQHLETDVLAMLNRTHDALKAAKKMPIEDAPLGLNALLSTLEETERLYKIDPLDEMGLRSGKFSLVFDCEVTSGIFNKTVGDARRTSETATDAMLQVFDLLPASVFNQPTSKPYVVPYRLRRGLLEYVVRQKVPDTAIKIAPRYLAHDEAGVRDIYGTMRDLGLEGVIVKSLDGLYVCKRSVDWQKIKDEVTDEYRVTGYYEGKGKYVGMLGGLAVDVDGVTTKVGDGFTDAQRKEIWDMIQSDPALVVGRLIEVEYHEKTPAGSLRHPRFLGWRDDKDPGVDPLAA